MSGIRPSVTGLPSCFALKRKPGGSDQLRTGLIRFCAVLNIHEDGPQHNVAWTILPALLIPETGTSLHTIAAPGGVKVLASVDMRPGGGLTRGARRTAVKLHDICQVVVHADLCRHDGKLPLAADFHAPTLLWALEKAEQIALWCERGTTHHAEVAAWIV